MCTNLLRRRALHFFCPTLNLLNHCVIIVYFDLLVVYLSLNKSEVSKNFVINNMGNDDHLNLLNLIEKGGINSTAIMLL